MDFADDATLLEINWKAAAKTNKIGINTAKNGSVKTTLRAISLPVQGEIPSIGIRWQQPLASSVQSACLLLVHAHPFLSSGLPNTAELPISSGTRRLGSRHIVRSQMQLLSGCPTSVLA